MDSTGLAWEGWRVGGVFDDNSGLKFSPVIHNSIRCGYSLEVPRRGASNEYPEQTFLLRNKRMFPRIITKDVSLRLCMLGKISADDILKYFLIFS